MELVLITKVSASCPGMNSSLSDISLSGPNSTILTQKPGWLSVKNPLYPVMFTFTLMKPMLVKKVVVGFGKTPRKY